LEICGKTPTDCIAVVQDRNTQTNKQNKLASAPKLHTNERHRLLEPLTTTGTFASQKNRQIQRISSASSSHLILQDIKSNNPRFLTGQARILHCGRVEGIFRARFHGNAHVHWVVLLGI
jgi:hypothetical protein